jgi:hypothetical protein
MSIVMYSTNGIHHSNDYSWHEMLLKELARLNNCNLLPMHGSLLNEQLQSAAHAWQPS